MYIYLNKTSLFCSHSSLESEGSHPVPEKERQERMAIQQIFHTVI